MKLKKLNQFVLITALKSTRGLQLRTKILSLVFMALLCSSITTKSQAPTTSTLITSSDVVADYAVPTKVWNTASFTREAYNIVSQKNGSQWYIVGVQYITPAPGYSLYGGGFAYQPRIQSLFKHLNVPQNNLNLLFDAGAGVINSTIFVTTATNGVLQVSKTNVGEYGSAALQYNFSNSLQWTTMRGGFIYSPYGNHFYLSTGLVAFFGNRR